MKEQATDEEEREIADCRLQTPDSKIPLIGIQTGNSLARSRRRSLWWFIAVMASVLVVIVAFYLDASVHSWLAQHQSGGLKKAMRTVSHYGDWPAHVALGAILAAAAWFRGSKRWLRIFLAMLVACALAGAAARVVKISTGRARPSVRTETVWNGPRLSAKYNAFPSGHTAASTAFFVTLLLSAGWRIGAPLLIVPISIAFSRMYVAAHYLSDVEVAALLGTVCAVVVGRWLFPHHVFGSRDSPRDPFVSVGEPP